MGLSSSEIGLISIMILLCVYKSYAQSKVFNILHFGATTNERIDSGKALSMAWSQACANHGGGVVLVPAVGRFLILPLTLRGPCKGFIKLQIDGDLVASPEREFAFGKEWLKIHRVNNFVIDGSGTLVGQGETAWPYNSCDKNKKCPRHPVSLRLQTVTGATIRKIKSLNSKLFHIGVNGCRDVTIDDITITAPNESPNTDGIHISKSTGINIMNSVIGTGDDCISMGPGSQNINITNVKCGPGHGISIGSLGKYPNEQNVGDIIVRDTTFTGTDNGVRIKTWSRSTPSIVSNIAYLNLEMNNVKNPIIIDQNYCPDKLCGGNKVSESTVQIKGVRFEDIKGSSRNQLAVAFICSQRYPCEGIVTRDIDLRFNGNVPSTSICSNVRGYASGRQQPPSCL